jgi:hypothetical protein
MTTFERKLATEDRDIAEIVAGILTVQSRFATKQHRSPGRGTHTKGTCVRGVFEVFDLARAIGDAGLQARLARGLFAVPGTYPATVRFANAASTMQPDFKRDVRALSFAVEVPPGVLGAEAVRHDFSMNDAPTFPINDAHAFAVFMRVAAATGFWGIVKAFATLSPAELWSLLVTGARGFRQQRGPAPYARQRYWRTVPFRHGPDDAAKYSAIPGPENPSGPVSRSDDMLRNDLLSCLTRHDRPIAFDFAIQLLEAGRMRHRGRTRDAIFWIENAGVEWKEGEAPFHVVGRLTLTPDSALSEEECQAQYIDVTEHSTPESHPLGSINRARWFAESASRRVRLGAVAPDAAGSAVTPSSLPWVREGAPLPAPAPPLRPWIGRITVGSLVRLVLAGGLALVLLTLGLAAATTVYLHLGGGMLPAETVDAVDYPDQGWGPGVEADGRETFYYTPQGAGLYGLRYSWFVNLEMPWGSRRFADPAVLSRYGFLVDPATAHNPDRLPVGFTKHFDRDLNEEVLDITCAACHTGQIQVTRHGRTRALRIDGGQANHAFTDADFGNFVPTLVASMASTAANPFKFTRFARRVLGARYPEGRWTLHRELRGVIGTFLSLAWTEKTRALYPTQEGYGRTDALARIANNVFAENLTPANYRVGNGPVSYPPLWNIWKFDWVQYNASVSQPMARNIGEAMGVGARYVLVDRYGRPLPPEQRFRSTALLEDIHTIEQTLRRLQPPAWQEGLLGPIDREKAERGRTLFDARCVTCHGPHLAPPAVKARNAPLKTDADPEWLIRTLCVDDVGTDPNAAMNFVNARVDITRTGMTAPELRRLARRTLEVWKARQTEYLRHEIEARRGSPAAAAEAADLERQLAGLDDQIAQQLSQIDPARLSVGAALSYLGTMIREKAYEDGRYSPAQRADFDGFGILDMPQVVAAYKPRPLAGIWATPPFLHNGSVPTIYDLLSPVADRPATFQVGSHEYDPERLGLARVQGFWTFDTSLSGNHNTGHEFNTGFDESAGSHQVRPGLIGPLLSHEERMAIIEYLKVRDDDRDGPKEPRIPPTPACLPAVR